MENIEIYNTTGIDKLPVRFLNNGAEILSRPINEICNLLMSQGIFPNVCKVTKFKPIFKKDKRVDPSNLQTCLVTVSDFKNLWKGSSQLDKWILLRKQILFNYQFGFRINHWKNLCLSFLTDKIRKGFDEVLLTGMILIDLQNVFDTMNHAILLKKLEAFFGPMYRMVSVISLWTNILYRNREPTVWLRKDIVRCTTRFSGFKIKSIFMFRWLMSHVPA